MLIATQLAPLAGEGGVTQNVELTLGDVVTNKVNPPTSEGLTSPPAPAVPVEEKKDYSTYIFAVVVALVAVYVFRQMQ